jgi:hypothetical protein
MRKLIILFLLVSSAVLAQKNQGRPDVHRIKAIKIGIITEKLQLSESQAERFWPLYNVYSDERAEVNRNIRQKIKGNSESNMSDSESLKRQDEILDLKEKDIQIERKYRDKFLKIISPKQYSDLLEAEHQFNKMLIEKLKEMRKN